MQQLTQQQRTLAEAAFANKLNVVHHAYVDITNDLVAGALLGQVLYWFGAGKDGKTRARIVKDGHYWIAKTRADWWNEIRISPKQYDRAAKILKDKGYIEVKTFKFAGNPTTHIRIVPEAINAALEAWKIEQVKTICPDGKQPEDSGYSPSVHIEVTKAAEPPAPSVQNDMPESGESITETPTETPTENTAENTHMPTAAPSEGVPDALTRHKLTIEEMAKGFEECWSEYPRKEGKQKARMAYERAVRGMGTRKPDGTPYTAAEILAEVVLYRQHIESRLERGEIEQRYVPTGGAWFEREGWTDDVPSISSSFEELEDAMEYSRNAGELRRCAAMIVKATEDERPRIWQRLRALRELLPY
jgi:hypothetical protein